MMIFRAMVFDNHIIVRLPFGIKFQAYVQRNVYDVPRSAKFNYVPGLITSDKEGAGFAAHVRIMRCEAGFSIIRLYI